VYFSYLVVLFYCHFIWFYLTCLNLIINGKWKWYSHTTTLYHPILLWSFTSSITLNYSSFPSIIVFTSRSSFMLHVCPNSCSFTHLVTHLVWPHQPVNPPRRPRAQRTSPRRSPEAMMKRFVVVVVHLQE